jgi:glyoxylase-like metal-dependent hydrolase (beta-lactamase superfamily II)
LTSSAFAAPVCARPRTQSSDLEEIAPGLHRWTARHPDWKPEEEGLVGHDPDVGCHAWETDDALVLIDPLVPESGEDEQLIWTELDEIASRVDRPIAVLLTIFWHERSTSRVFERYSKTLGARVYAHEPAIDRIDALVTDPFRIGDKLPGGIQAFEAQRSDEVVFWLPAASALAVGDVILGRKDGLRLFPESWSGGDRMDEVRAALRQVLDLPIETVLTGHGPPVLARGRDALAKALTE